MPDPSPGATIAGRYTILSMLGEGGMGQVLRARDTKLDRDVALKLLAARTVGDANARERLVREARAAGKLAHPGIVHVYDVGETDDGGAFLVMELVSGKTLRDLVSRGGASDAEIIRILVECARALAFAHRAGSVHRDVKPDNIMVRDDGRAVLLDFGIAKTMLGDAATLTGAGMVVGTPAYLAPEQARGEEVDGGADQFALAVTAYEALGRRMPWTGASAAAIVAEILRDDPAPVSRLAPALPRELDAVLARAMAKRAADRYPDCDAFADALHDVAGKLGTSPAAVPPSLARTEAIPSSSTLSSVRPPARRRPATWIAATAAGAVVLVVAVAGLSGALGRHAQTPAASVPPPSPPSPTAVTDLPLPTTTNLEALADYKAGIQATRDANVQAIAHGFQRASELDPSMAAAHWRYANILFGRGQIEEAREALNRALLQRSALTPRDLAMVDAYDVLIRRAPPDLEECERRMRAIAQTYPLDAEVWLALGGAAFVLDRYEEAERSARRALELDPKFAYAWLLVAWSRDYRGLHDDAERAYQSCVSVSSNAATCLRNLAQQADWKGHCDSFDATAERLIAVDPSDPAAYDMRASAVARAGGEPATMHVALREAARRQRDPRSGAGAADDVFDLWVGDFADLVGRRSSGADASAASEKVDDESVAAQELVLALRESRRDDAARREAAAFLARRPLLSVGGFLSKDGHDRSSYLLGVARSTGGMSRAEWAKLRDAWFAERTAKGHASAGDAWRDVYAAGALTRLDAEEALAVMPRGASSSDPRGDLALGNLYALLERWDEALPFLERATHQCDVLFDVPALVQAHVALGQAYEAGGDTARACEQYAWLVQRWAGARPRSETAEHAGGRMRALGCKP